MYDPERYEKNKSAALRDADQFVPLLIGDMTWDQEKENILDYGCGAGSTGAKYFVPQAEKYNSMVYSVDISEDMIGHARKAYPNPRVTYSVGNILSDEFPHRNMKFDKIFAVYVLHFVKDYRGALQRFYDQLKPGGQLGFTVLTKSTLYVLHEKLGKSEKWSKYMKGYENYVPEWFQQKEEANVTFKRNLEACGFDIVKLSVHKQQFSFEKFETLIELYLSLNPFIKTIPKDLHDDVRQEYREFLANHWNIKPNAESIDTTYELLYAVARKP